MEAHDTQHNDAASVNVESVRSLRRVSPRRMSWRRLIELEKYYSLIEIAVKRASVCLYLQQIEKNAKFDK